MTLFLHLFIVYISMKLGNGNSETELFKLVSPNSRLDNSIVKNVANLSALRCAITCTRHQSAIAFNYNKVNGNCELIEVDPTAQLITDDNYSYYTRPSKSEDVSKPDPCQSQPCSHGRNCSLTSNGMNYECSECPYPFTGDNCELLANPLCAKSIDTVYCGLDILPNPSWNDSYGNCIEKGMRLAMFKDQNSHEFMKDKLTRESAASTIYWIGLRRIDHESEWMWIDGSPLGEYRPWHSDPYEFWPGLSCVQINGGPAKYDFVPDECGVLTVEKIRYIPLCERKLIP